MYEPRESFWTQVGQVLLGICIFIGAGVLLVGAIKLFEAVWPSIKGPFWYVVGHGLAWGLILAFVFIGIMVAASPIYSTATGWRERSVPANGLRVIGAGLCVLLGLWIVLIAVESGISVFF